MLKLCQYVVTRCLYRVIAKVIYAVTEKNEYQYTEESKEKNLSLD